LNCALSRNQAARCSCRGRGALPAVSGDCRLDCSTAQRFRTEFLAHTDSNRFPDTGLCPNSQPHSYSDSEGSHQNHFQPNPDANAHSNTDPDTIVSRFKCHTNSHANARASSCVALAALA
jgi:hypothetical protein